MPTAALILAQDLRFASLACELTHKFAIRLNLQVKCAANSIKNYTI